MAAKRKPNKSQQDRKEPQLATISPSAEPSSQSAEQACADPTETPQLDFPVVGIGISNGQSDASRQFFGNVPANAGAAFVLVPNGDPPATNATLALLARLTAMPVSVARDGLPIKPNHVYVNPPENYLAIDHGLLRAAPSDVPFDWSTAVDRFFRSLAAAQHELAIGVMLSRPGKEQLGGLKQISLAGGMVVVPPGEVLESGGADGFEGEIDGLADLVIRPERMPRAIGRNISTRRATVLSDTGVDPDQYESLSGILGLLQSRTLYGFHGYRKNMLLRRIRRRMELLKIEWMSDYLDLLREQNGELAALFKDMLIGTTEFFRDPAAFDVLQHRVLPEFPTDKKRLRVWVPACSTGAEAYSIAMLFAEHFDAMKNPPDLLLFATDINESSLEVARQGIYFDADMENVSAERRDRFFHRVDDTHWQIDEGLRKSSIFASQNLFSDVPFLNMDLISCRNLLIYLEPDVQEKLIELFHFALNVPGYLMLGISESIGARHDLFEPMSRRWCVFQRRAGTRPNLTSFPIVAVERRVPIAALPSTERLKPANTIHDQMQRWLLEDLAPAAALINDKCELISVFGPLVDYFEFPAGEFNNDLPTMARPGLRGKLRTAIQEAIRTEKTVTDNNIMLRRNGNTVWCSIVVRPIKEPNLAKGLLLIALRDLSSVERGTAQPPTVVPFEDESMQLVRHVEAELKSTREELRSTAEEYQIAIGHLRSSHEEVVSMNEELQSANEEMVASKEEQQSLNEELNVINSQLEEKVDALDRANHDLLDTQARLRASETFNRATLDSLIANIAVLDASGLIVATNQTWKQFAEDNKTRGQSVGEGVNYLAVCDRASALGDTEAAASAEAIRNVLAGKQEYWLREYPCHSPDEKRWFYCRVTRFETDGHVHVVVAHENITGLKQAQEQLAASLARFDSLARISPVGITLFDAAGQCVDVNRCWMEMTGIDAVGAQGDGWLAAVHPDERERVAAEWRTAVQRQQAFVTESRVITRGGRPLWVLCQSEKIVNARGELTGYVRVQTDISRQKRIEAALRWLTAARADRSMRELREDVVLRVAELLDVEIACLCRQDPNAPDYCETLAIAIDGRIEANWRYAAQGTPCAELEERRACVVPRGARQEYPADEFLASQQVESYAAVRLIDPAGHDMGHLAVLSRKPLSDPDDVEAVLSLFAMSLAAEMRRQHLAQRLSDLFEFSPDAIVLSNADRTITQVNRQAERIFGWTRQELVGQSIEVLLPSEKREQHVSLLRQYLETAECSVLDSPGAKRRTAYSASLTQDPTDRVVGAGLSNWQALRKDGTVFDIDITHGTLESEGETLFAAAMRDVTENRRVASLRATEHAVLLALANAPSPERGAEVVLRSICQLLGWDYGGCWMVDPGGQILRLLAHWRIAEARIEPFVDATLGAHFERGVGLPGQVWETHQPIWIDDVTSSANFQRTAVARACHLRGAFACPILVGGNVIGVLDFFSQKILNPDDMLLDTFLTIGSQIGQFIARCEAGRSLRSTEARYRELFQSSRDAIMTLSLETGRFTSANPATLQMFGAADEDEFCSLGPWNTSPEFQPDGRRSDEAARERIDRAAREGSQAFEWTHRRLDGSEFPASVLLTRCQVNDVSLLQATVRDISEEKRVLRELETVAQQLRAANALVENERASLVRRVAERTAELTAANEELMKASLAKSEFLANMSHELRTPLNGILGMNTLLMQTELTARQRQYAEVSSASGKLLLQIINDILDISKIEAGKLELDFRECDIERLVHEVVDMLMPASQQKGLNLSFCLAPEARVIAKCDDGRLRQVLVNLVSNAIKFTPSGDITIVGRMVIPSNGGARLHVSVADTGIGIPAERLDRLFKAFSQVDSSMTRNYGGTGLGLSICRQLITLMGGVIGVESQVGVGSTFWFEIPLEIIQNPTAAGRFGVSEAPPEAPPRPVTDTRLSAASSATSAKVRGHVLVAEDNRVNQIYIVELLKYFGCTCDLVENGEQALIALERQPYDLILMDCQMPEMDGFSAAREIRRRESSGTLSRPRVSIVALTANALAGDRERCLQAGMDEYLAKPVDGNQLKAILDRFVGRSTDETDTRGGDL